MAKGRFEGFVVGSDIVDNKKVWKVRVKMKSHRLNEKKFVVASVHDNIALVQGLDVSFLLGTFQEFGKTVKKAVDITLM